MVLIVKIESFLCILRTAGAVPSKSPAGKANTKPFILLSSVFAAAAIPDALLAWRRRKDEGTDDGGRNRSRIIATAAAAAAILLSLLTAGWQGIAIANPWTVVVAVLAAGSLICAWRRK